MTNDGYVITPGKKELTPQMLAGYKILVIANASTNSESTISAFTSEECECVKGWVKSGGSLLLVTDHEPFGSASADLAKPFGVEMTCRVASDQENETGNGLLFSRENLQIGNHPIMAGRDESERVNRVLTFTGQSLKGPPESWQLLRFSETAFKWNNDNPSAQKNDDPKDQIDPNLGRWGMSRFGIEVRQRACRRHGRSGRTVRSNHRWKPAGPIWNERSRLRQSQNGDQHHSLAVAFDRPRRLRPAGGGCTPRGFGPARLPSTDQHVPPSPMSVRLATLCASENTRNGQKKLRSETRGINPAGSLSRAFASDINSRNHRVDKGSRWPRAIHHQVRDPAGINPRAGSARSFCRCAACQGLPTRVLAAALRLARRRPRVLRPHRRPRLRGSPACIFR